MILPIHRTPHTVFNYEEIPPGYYFKVMVEGGATQRFWHQKKFEKIADHVSSRDRVIDFGCGPGSLLYTLAHKHPEIVATGVDVAEAQICFAQTEIAGRFPHAQLRFDLLQPQSRKLPFENATFDVFTCVEVIEHIHPHLALNVLLEARRLLKPNGRLLVTTPNYRSLWPVIEWALEKRSPVKYHEQHISRFTPNSLVKFIETAGFEVKKTETFFLAAPFLAPLSWRFAESLHRMESVLHAMLGSLLFVEAVPLSWE